MVGRSNFSAEAVFALNWVTRILTETLCLTGTVRPMGKEAVSWRFSCTKRSIFSATEQLALRARRLQRDARRRDVRLDDVLARDLVEVEPLRRAEPLDSLRVVVDEVRLPALWVSVRVQMLRAWKWTVACW